jgi:two-component sensor histidine kinase
MRSLFLRLGRPSATSNVTLLWVFLLVNLGTLLPGSRGLGTPVSALVVPSLVSAAVFVVILLALRHPLHRVSRPEVRSIATLMVIVIAWIIRSLVFSLMLNQVGEAQIVRTVMGILFICFIMLIVSELIDRRNSHKLLLDDLADRRMNLLLSQATFSERLSQAKSELDQTIRDTMEPSYSMLDLAFSVNRGANKDIQPAQLLHDILKLSIRPALTDLSASNVAVTDESQRTQFTSIDASRETRRIDIPDCIRPALMVLPIRIFTFIVYLSFTSFVSALSGFIALLMTWPILALVRRYWPSNVRELPVLSAIPTLTFVFLVAFGSPLFLMIALIPASRFFFKSYTGVFSILSVFFAVGIAWCIAAVQIVERRRRLVEQELRDTNEDMQISISQMRQELWYYRRNMMWIIHGPVQSALISAALKLEAPVALDETQMRDLRNDIDAAYATLDSGGIEDPDFIDFLSSLRQLWRGLCEISVNDLGETITRIDESPSTAAAVIEIVREAVGNAVRHGSATTVSITIDSEDERLLKVVIVDNGSGIADDAIAGLGSELFDSLTFRWSRSSSTRGTEVQAEITWGTAL